MNIDKMTDEICGIVGDDGRFRSDIRRILLSARSRPTAGKPGRRTAHEFARELLALPDLPLYHFDPSFADACDEETDYALGRPTASVDDPCEGLTAGEISDAKANGFDMGKHITICGDQPEDMDRGAEEEIP